MTPPAGSPKRARPNRREFLAQSAAGATGLGAWLGTPAIPRTLAAAAPSGTTALPSPSSPTDSSVGSLFPFIQSQAVHGEFPLSFLQPRFRSVRSWRRTARGKVLDLLHYAPPKVDPRGTVLERVDCGDYLRERVEFNTTPDLRIPAFVLVPKNVPLPAPAIIALHDHGGFYLWGKEKIVAIEGENPELTAFRNQYYGGRSTALELVKRGYVVIVIDMFYWGDRRLLLDRDPDDWRIRPNDLPRDRIQAFNRRAGQNESLVGRTLFTSGITWPGIIFWDDIRTVDYLLTRPEVDPTRIGCVGLSVGGLRACHLAALDERIRAAVVVGWMASFPAQLRSQVENTIGHTKVIPGLYRHLDYPDVAALAMPRPMLVINGSRDGLFQLDGVKASFRKLEACYAKAGVPGRILARLYDTPHEFNERMQTEAWSWLQRWM